MEIRWLFFIFLVTESFAKLTTGCLLSHGSTITLWPKVGFALSRVWWLCSQSCFWKPFLLWVDPLHDSNNANNPALYLIFPETEQNSSQHFKVPTTE